MLEQNKIYLGDCLELMKQIDDKSIDMIICDLPYNITGCKWDVIIPFEPLWNEYKRIIKDGCAIVLTASQPFTSALVMSNLKWFKCEWVWQKNAGSNFGCVKWQPMKEHESVLVFGKGKVKYNPIMQERAESGKERVKTPVKTTTTKTDVYADSLQKYSIPIQRGELRYPSSVQKFNRERGLHPTQKPEKLYEYMIKTYSNDGDLILDNCCGSGTIAVANTIGRNYIAIEKDECYWKIACERAGKFSEQYKNIVY